MSFSLPPLPYSPDALGPVISGKTLEFHHGKHHQTYVNNLNALIPGSGFESASLEQIILKSDGAVFNNAAQIWNHTFFFESLMPPASQTVPAELMAALQTSFGNFDAFREAFNKAAVSLFGSGWAWLSKKADGSLVITQEANAGNPMRSGLIPLLTCDVWEHAYYLDYQNRRADFVNAFWNVINWNRVAERLHGS